MTTFVQHAYEKLFTPYQASPYVVKDIVDLTQPSLWIAVVSILFNPTFWNIVAQNEHRNRTITKILGGRSYLGCYLLAVTIFSLGILRDMLYNRALAVQPTNPALDNHAVRVLAVMLFAVGNVLVISSMYVLGVTGTYLGDYFGILMDHMVTGFPFNVVADPMYWGSSANFVAVALWYAKPAGLLLSVVVIATYAVALQFEGPFTSNIYKEAAERKQASKANVESMPVSKTPVRPYATRAATRSQKAQ
ncbi:protein kinase C [Malassezia brasiliensis]|uniref:Phosphatidyl-N-methylethanolamine N-methyltransferase n=1 Tax=Malassezia brasiliensis TaxID=1821822 RepID=A0AAF0IMS1_9BASI|nr:protein kinase C [Malassezia brasiliensis]